MRKGPLEAEYLPRLADYDVAGVDLRDAVSLYFQPGEAILREGMPMEYLLFVISGKAKVCSAASNGRDLILCYYISEGIVGDEELMTGAHIAGATIIAATEFHCIGLPYAKYADALKANLAFVNRVGKELAVKLFQSSHNGTAIALHSGEERLCTYILQTARGDVFSEPLTDAARSIGTSYRHLLRLLSRLRAEGVMQKEASEYRIINRPELIRRSRISMGIKNGLFF